MHRILILLYISSYNGKNLEIIFFTAQDNLHFFTAYTLGYFRHVFLGFKIFIKTLRSFLMWCSEEGLIEQPWYLTQWGSLALVDLVLEVVSLLVGLLPSWWHVIHVDIYDGAGWNPGHFVDFTWWDVGLMTLLVFMQPIIAVTVEN